MIRYALKCAEHHPFESWFQSVSAFETLQASNRLACPVCGSAKVEKSLMAPAVRPARQSASDARPEAEPVPASPVPNLATPSNDLERAMAALRREVEKNSEYVGLNFASEARAIHDGDAPTRPIYGEAKPEEARKLIEDGVPVAPLPFMPQRKVN